MSAPVPVRYAAYAAWTIAGIDLARMATWRSLNTATLIGLGYVALLAAAAYFLLRGANWGRIVSAVLAVVGIPAGMVAGIGPGSFSLRLTFVALTLLLCVALVVLVFGREANRFFEQNEPASPT